MLRVARLVTMIAALLGIVTFAPVCAVAQVQASAESADQATDPAIADYILGAGDNLRIIVFGEVNLTGQFTVATNGHISFPLIGDVQAAGKTVQELRSEITAALADGYVKDPKVSAEVMTFRPYYILGEVEKPGEYPYIGGITVMNAIATAGGFTYRANNHDVFIKKANDTAEHKVRLNDALELSPGDTLRVGERYF
jgi:protein involved in polysaccharide export with SLBB domain